jgi:hypothetical protein
VALQIHLAVPADIDQAGKILVIAGVALTGVVEVQATGERRAAAASTMVTIAASNTIFLNTLSPPYQYLVVSNQA